jgi:hypothetical protein
MKHQITAKDISTAMKVEIILASSWDPTSKKAKDLKFTPYDLTYRVRFYDGSFETSNAYKDPGDAIEKYNDYDA